MATPSLGAGQVAAAVNSQALLFPPATSPPLGQEDSTEMVLELADGTAYRGISFGAEGKSISGECVFQTGKFYKPHTCCCILCTSNAVPASRLFALQCPEIHG